MQNKVEFHLLNVRCCLEVAKRKEKKVWMGSKLEDKVSLPFLEVDESKVDKKIVEVKKLLMPLYEDYKKENTSLAHFYVEEITENGADQSVESDPILKQFMRSRKDKIQYKLGMKLITTYWSLLIIQKMWGSICWVGRKNTLQGFQSCLRLQKIYLLFMFQVCLQNLPLVLEKGLWIIFGLV
ncbi:unnamed protein product [Prunus armeniaca]|uniref:Uncharacterized protein n=1 Tax=Prunus armeniaca TaxID=36596 RepID=A0A6J5XKW5_PRUAR|nr:unnamed protein product [Prunus armeniaca]